MPRPRPPDNPNDNRFVRIARDFPDRRYLCLASAVIAAAIEDERVGDQAATEWLQTTGLRWLSAIRPTEG